MFEAYVLLSVLGLGYVMKQQAASKQHPTSDVPQSFIAGDTPSAKTLHDSGNYWKNEVLNNESARANRAFVASQAPHQTGVISRTSDASVTAPTQKNFVSELSGDVIPIEHFTHDNMTPFFGGSVKQNTRAEALNPAFEALSGSFQYRPLGVKRETAPLFKPTPQHGVLRPLADHVARENAIGHIMPSIIRNNELPFDRELVGRPGVMGGETGDVYYDSRKAALPIATDQLRAINNPKETFDGRVVDGLHTTSRRAAISAVAQHRPSLIAEQIPVDGWLKTTGAVTHQRMRPAHIDAKDTARQDTSKAYMGSASYIIDRNTARYAAPPEVHKSTLPAMNQGAVYVPNTKQADRSGTVMVYANQRDITTTRTYQGNVATTFKAMVAPLMDALRTTVKETHVADAPLGNATAAVPKLTVYDANDVARTTIKQTQLVEAPLGNLRGPVRITVYDPQDVARVTNKEVSLHDPMEYGGIMNPAVRRGHVVNPDESARPTIRQTVDPADPVRNFTSSTRPTTRDPDALNLPPTVRQVITEQMTQPTDGNLFVKSRGGAYATTDARAPLTQRQQYSDENYIGTASKPITDGGYQIANTHAPETQKQQLSDINHFGIAEGLSKATDHASYDAARTNTSKEHIAEGRAPTDSSVKIASGADSLGADARDPRYCVDERIDIDYIRPSVLVNMPPSSDASMDTRTKPSTDNALFCQRLVQDVVSQQQITDANPLALPPLALT